MSQEIHKKATPEYFQEVISGKKTFDVRLADWECQEGDILVLDEINATTKQPTGRSIKKKVGFILKTKNFNLFPAKQVEQYGYQVISLLDESDVSNGISQCPGCELHYVAKKDAERCEQFCKEHSACNPEIAQHSLEVQKGRA